MKNILYLSNLRLPTEKAYGIQIAKMCEAFAGAGAVVELAYPSRRNPIKTDIFAHYSVKRNFKVKKIPAPDYLGASDKFAVGLKSAVSAVILAVYALSRKTNIIYSRDELILYLLSFFRKGLVFEAHRFSTRRAFFYSRFNSRRIKLISISEAIKKDLVNSGYDPGLILVAHDGVDLEEFNVNILKSEAKKTFYRDFFQRAEGKRIAVYIGSHFSWKGVKIFSEVAKYFSDPDPNLIIAVFGGTDNDAEKIKEDFERIRKDLHPHVLPMIYAKSHIPHQDVPLILRASDCAILTGDETQEISSRYTSPLKMFEYMASGCPIVAQDLSSFREVLNDSNAIFAKPGDAEDLAEKLLWTVDEKNSESVKKKAEQALEDVKQYTWQKRADLILNFLGR